MIFRLGITLGLYALVSLISFWLGLTQFYIDYRPHIYWLSVCLGPASFLMSEMLFFYIISSIVNSSIAVLYWSTAWKRTFLALSVFIWVTAGFLGSTLHAALHYV